MYFISDLAFNLPGFNISYEHGSCLNNCNENGKCLHNGSCLCERGFSGESCENQLCLHDSEKGHCQNGAICMSNRCECSKFSQGKQKLVNNRDFFYHIAML